MDWYKLTAEEAVRQLQMSIETGLTETEAAQRLERYGPNELVKRGAKPPWRIFVDQFKEAMVLVLIVAAMASALLGEWTEVVVILAIVVLNAILGFTQEYRAERAMEALEKLAVPTVRVRRGGRVQEISSTDLVPGDILLLETGNIVSADGRLVESVNLRAQEAALTGESEPVDKSVAVPAGDELPLGDRKNVVFRGTVITYGRGTAVVAETGMNTELGHIAGLIESAEDVRTPLQRRLAGLGKTLAWVALGIIALVVVTGLLRGDDLETLFLTGVSLAVAVIPESLLAVVTITLALGGQKLLQRRALIRNLPAVETLGSVTVICSDKTGTLTQNRMTVTLLDVEGDTEQLEALVERKGALHQARLVDPETPPDLAAKKVLVIAGALCNDAILETGQDGVDRAIGDPTEGALVLAAKDLEYDKAALETLWPRVAEVPFTSERKRMTTIHKTCERVQRTDLPWCDAAYVSLSKGAVDSLLEITTHVFVEKREVPLDEELRERILAANDKFAQEGQRVLAVGYRTWDEPELPDDETQLEADVVFVGLVTMIDPPRPEVREAVKTAQAAGIRPVMITGDHPLTALQIAKDLGIAGNEHYLTGQDLARMSIPELEQQIEDVSVYARVSPEHKINIVAALQNKGEVAAMTGDGVNDAPALKQANIGVAMGITGTDVSKEAADMILLDDNFATIVAAVEEGRTIYDNIRKFIKYTLSSNTGELLLVLLAPFLGMPLPLLPLQILWVNLVTDGLPGIALAEEPSERGVMKRPPFHPQEGVFSRGVGTQIIWIGALVGLISLGMGYVFWRMDPSGPWRTMVFTTLVLAQMGNALAIRSDRDSLFLIGIVSNRLMVIAVLAGVLLQLAITYIPFGQGIFNTRALTPQQFGLCVLAGVAVFAVVELYKWLRRRREIPSTTLVGAG